jgi:hypothetical protein
VGVGDQTTMTTPLNDGEIAHHAQHRLLLRALDVRGADEFRGAAELCARPGRGDLRHGFAAAHQRARIGLHAGAGLDGNRFSGKHRLVEQDFSPAVMRTSAATTPPSESFTMSPGTSFGGGPRSSRRRRAGPTRSTRAAISARRGSPAHLLSWRSPRAALKATGEPVMIDASTALPSAQLEQPRSPPGESEHPSCSGQTFQRAPSAREARGRTRSSRRTLPGRRRLDNGVFHPRGAAPTHAGRGYTPYPARDLRRILKRSRNSKSSCLGRAPPACRHYAVNT